MSEGGVSKKDALLIGTAVLGLGGAAATSVIEGGNEMKAEWEKQHPDVLSENYIVKIKTKKDGKPLNFRSTAFIPHDPSEGSNLIRQNEIELGDGKTAADVDEFYVQDYVLEDGYDADTGAGSTGRWLAFHDMNGDLVRMYMGPKTHGYWETIINEKIKAEQKRIEGKLDQNGFTTTEGEHIPAQEIGKVSLEMPTVESPRE